ncbi:SRPBCC domain-containing protein [Paenibacillus sp. M1]|uniref:SRPBCC domain-containing protein n=1 Tax=Paenibacillus haidiansis TaxID=1574488 RepID=A0ABU7VZJ1_9BACL
MNVNPSKRDIVITREYEYPVELVWKAWTDPTLVMKWWKPTNFTSPSCEIDLRVGGKYVFSMRAPDTQGGMDSFSADRRQHHRRRISKAAESCALRISGYFGAVAARKR